MALPLPRRQSDLQAGSLNLSLHFDHGYDGYDPRSDWAHRKADPKRGIVEGKTEFLRTFAKRSIDPKVYDEFRERREAALELRSASRVEATSTAPLLVGLGRWNPTEIWFNLDRFTGCPFIPGSSVKGLLREAARLGFSSQDAAVVLAEMIRTGNQSEGLSASPAQQEEM